MRTLRRLAGNTRGATAIEYGLILSLVFIALAVGVSNLGQQVFSTWSGINTKFVGAS